MHERDARPQYAVIWPLAPVSESTPAPSPAARPTDLHGRRIGLIWDYLFHGDEMFVEIRRRVAERYRDVRFVEPDAFGNIHGPDEEDVIARLPIVLRRTGVESVIAAVGA